MNKLLVPTIDRRAEAAVQDANAVRPARYRGAPSLEGIGGL
jgi:hypothetical protein